MTYRTPPGAACPRGMSRQLALRLEPRTESEAVLRRAWTRTSQRIPYDVAIRVPAIAICLRNIAAAEKRRRIRRAARERLRPETDYRAAAAAAPGDFTLAP